MPSPKALTPAKPAFPIVGIGASAGGLEALELLLSHVPADSGMAFVVVQHLDPTHQGILAELLGRVTAMPVAQVSDRTKVRPNHVYVIPPNTDLSLLHGQLHLLEPVAPRGLRLPIDFFFRSLAQDRGDGAIGIILSGMGSDGTLGLRAIKEVAGLAFVQSPASARFDGMPRSAIDAGMADVVAPPEELIARVLASLRRNPAGPAAGPEKDGSALDKIVILLRSHTGQDFSQYKKPTIRRRIERRMGLHQLGRVQDYVRYLRENPRELDLLFQELLIGVTQFFRDPEAWARLMEVGWPELLANLPQDGQLRAWCAGCSTGEEAYSLAISFREALAARPNPLRHSLVIFATDLDHNAIDRARNGLYPTNVAADLSAERLERYFQREEGGYRVRKEIREMVIFAPQNISMDPPFTKLDLLVCRNLLIYLDPELQKRILPLFHYSLKPGGMLFLGSAETIGAATCLFTPLDRKFRLYRRLNPNGRVEMLEFPSRILPRTQESPLDPKPPKVEPIPNLQALTDQFLLHRYVPSAVLVGPEGDILFTSGRTGKYLEPAVGKANLNIFAMAREGLGTRLHEAFLRAKREQSSVFLHQVKVGSNGGAQHVDISVDPLQEPAPLRGKIMIVFADVAAPAAAPVGACGAPPKDPSLLQAHEALSAAQAELQVTREEMQTSREELKSTNEELQSINEELQSTNEELTTSKEEMQSMNEELQTVNHELQAKVDELSSVNNDLNNLLNSTDIATLFLDENYRVRRFTTQAAAIIRLLPGDVGRPITDITSILVFPELVEDVNGVLANLVFRERRVATQDHRWFNVRVMPYRTSDNHIDGVVITFADITQVCTLEAALAKAQAELAQRGVQQP